MDKPVVPSTITDRQWASLARRAEKVAPLWFSGKAIKQRQNSNAQRRKAHLS